MLKGKTVLLGVTGGIAAYKAAALASALVKQHAAVEVVMTENATQFVTPLTFEQLTGRRTMVNTFDRNFSHQVEHIALAERTDLVIGHGQCLRETGPRAGGRYAHHHHSRLPLPQAHRPRHEYQHV